MNEAVKYDGEKLRLDLIPPEAIEGLGDVLTYGANKYNDHNWEQGTSWMRIYAALQRHLLAFHRGIDIDEESGMSHLKHALANVSFLLTYQDRNIGTDDRLIIERTK